MLNDHGGRTCTDFLDAIFQRAVAVAPGTVARFGTQKNKQVIVVT
jgi:hypothetical protein